MPIVRAAVKLQEAPRLPVDLRGLRHEPRPPSSIPTRRTLVYGPINKPRWIYACSKQLMDRVIAAYGMEQGPRLHALSAIQLDRRRASTRSTRIEGRVVPRRHAVPRSDRARRERSTSSTAGGRNAPSPTSPTASARLMKHPREPRRHRVRGSIYNIGNPRNHWSVKPARRDRCSRWRRSIPEYADRGRGMRASSRPRRGDVLWQAGYQDVQEPTAEASTGTVRRPRLEAEASAWKTSLRRIFESYRTKVVDAQLAHRGRAEVRIGMAPDRAEGRRRHLARQREKAFRDCSLALGRARRRRCHLSVQPRTRPHRLGIAAGLPAGLPRRR